MQTRAERLKAVQDKIAEVKALVKQKYNMDLSDLVVRYDLTGRTAGWAIGYRTIRLNTTAIYGDEAHFKDMVEDTVPHEIAHIVCHRNPSLGDKHDAGWAAVCRALGGTGKRTHDMTTIEFARGRTYIYTTTTGKEYGISERRHNKVQRGWGFKFRNAVWGSIDQYCAYTVKVNGRVINTYPARQRPAQTGGIGTLFGGLFSAPPAKPAPALHAYTMPAGTKVVQVDRSAVTIGTGSKADQVRAWIRAAKAAGNGQDYVIGQAQRNLGMARSQAYRYVTENWNRA